MTTSAVTGLKSSPRACRLTSARQRRDGRRAAIPDWLCNAVQVADVPGRRVIGAVTGLGRPHGVEIAPDNRVAFVTLGREKAVAVVDLETRRVLARHAVQSSAWGGDRHRGGGEVQLSLAVFVFRVFAGSPGPELR
jgi:DNA-binding beta-propeller fold protein YncE